MARPLLRPGLLDGVAVTVAGPRRAPLGDVVAAVAAELGARVARLAVDPSGDEPPRAGSPHQLVWDGAGAFAAQDGADAVRAALDGAWLALRAVAVAGWIAAGRPGQAVLLAPAPGDAHAAAARAGLENLARTLSIEWSRHGIRPVALCPGAGTEPRAVAELCAFLASPAGDYHSGSVISLA
jgi:NAD(P)-dependent dehydrogenase (short-subunit alcohol dehydrogenase family)